MIEAKKKLLLAQKSGIDISDVYNTSLWTGTGAARTITTGIDSGEGSLVWIKSRSNSASHALFDTSRGPNQVLQTNTSSGSQNAGAGWLDSFTSTGYVLGSNAEINQSGRTLVGWQFRRAEKFFDIVQYTGNGVSGRQIAHNLGVKPGMIIVKQTNTTGNWRVYQQTIGATNYLNLNSTGQAAPSVGIWANTEPTDVNFTVGSQADINGSGGTFIAYLFAHDPSPEGLIQCGSYVGNGSATGPVVNLGWRPQYLMVKSATVGTGSWFLIDSTRGVDNFITANSANAEAVTKLFDFNDNGFQPVYVDDVINGSGHTYIYMAIREAS